MISDLEIEQLKVEFLVEFLNKQVPECSDAVCENLAKQATEFIKEFCMFVAGTEIEYDSETQRFKII